MAAPTACMAVLFCDILSQHEARAPVETLPGITASGEVLAELPNGLLPLRLIPGAASSCVSEVQWKVSHYQEGADWRPNDGNCGPSEWTACDDAHVRVLPDATGWLIDLEPAGVDAQDRIAPAERQSSKLTLQDGQLHHCRDVGEDEEEWQFHAVKIELEVSVWLREFPRNGVASQGKAYFALADPERGVRSLGGVARTLLHELAHNMGLAYGSRVAMPDWGRAEPIPGLPFPATLPVGTAHQDKDFTGPHCAFHLTAVERASASFHRYTADRANRCIMWGESGLDSENDRFCPHCTDAIMAGDLRDITRRWRT